MLIIEVNPLANGAHRNQTSDVVMLPNGWAIVPFDMAVPKTFPFVDIAVVNGVVTSMSAGVVPAPEPQPAPTMTTEEAMMDAIADLTYRMDLQTLGLTEVTQ